MTELSPSLTEIISHTLSPAEVLDQHSRFDTITPDIHRMVNLYPVWHQEQLTPEQLGHLTWYLDPDPNHISQILTRGGKRRSVAEVADEFLSQNRQEILERWDKAKTIWHLVDCLEKGETLPPLIIIPGSRYPDSPECSFIDGVHRSLAQAVFIRLHPEKHFQIDAFVGKKANPVSRLIRKFSA